MKVSFIRHRARDAGKSIITGANIHIFMLTDHKNN